MSLTTDVNHAQKKGRRRRTARFSAGLTAAALVASGLAVLAAPQAASAASPLSCINTIYYTTAGTGQNPHPVREVTLTGTGGSVQPNAAFTVPQSSGTSPNQLGIAAEGLDAYLGTNTSVVDYNAAAGATTAHAKPSGVTNGTVGAVNPQTGLYYYGSYSGSGSATTLSLYVYNPATQQAPAGRVATVSMNTTPPGANGDIAFDKAGRLYLVNSLSTYKLYVVNADLPTTPNGTTTGAALTSQEIATGTLSGVDANGIAFASDGYLYLGGGTTLRKANPITGAPVTTFTAVTLAGSTDLATCANPSTTTVETEFPDGKDQPGDKTEVVVGGGSYGDPGTGPDFPTGTPNPDGTTTTPPGVVLPGEEYTVEQKWPSGNPDNYDTTWVCKDTEGNVIASGTGNTAKFTVPTGTDGASITCTFENRLVAPAATPDTDEVIYGGTATLAGATNDTAGTGRALDLTSVVFTANNSKTLVTAEGTFTANLDGTITFVPADGYTGTTPAVPYQVSDDRGLTATSTVTVTVRPGPTATPETASTAQGTPVDVTPLNGDIAGQNADGSAGTIDPSTVVFPNVDQPAGSAVTDEGRTLTVPGEGVYTIDPTTGVTTFTPEDTFFGPATPVTYEFTDGNGQKASSTITITVTEVTPSAAPDSTTTPYGTPVTVDVIDNDTAGPGGSIDPTKTVFIDPAATDDGKTLVTDEGTWTIDEDGEVTFTPNDGYSGTTPAVEYQITDENGQTATSTVTVTVRPGPTATPETATTPQGTPVDVTPLNGDNGGQNVDGTVTAIDPSTVTFPATGQPANAEISTDGRTLTVPGEGVYTIDEETGVTTFMPEDTFFGVATPVSYEFTDANGNTAGSTITITVNEVTPIAAPDTANTPYATPVTVDVIDNDTAGPGGSIDPTKTVFTDPAATDDGKTLVTDEGTWTIDEDGKITFDPADEYSGTTPAVEYQITDENGQTATSTVTVTVRPGPTAAPDSDTTPQNVDVTFPILGNDTAGLKADGTAGSFDNDSVTFVVTPTLPAGSEVSSNGRELTVPGEGVYTFDPATGEVTFDPEAQFTGIATAVTYEVTDQAGNTASSTITITVTPITPVATDDAAKTPGQTPVVIDPLENDRPGADSAPLDPGTVVFTSPDATDDGKKLETPEGTWTIDEDGKITFDPADDFEGTTPPVEYEVRDENGTPATGEIVVVVGGGALAAPDAETTKQGQPVDVSILENDAASDLGTPCEEGQTEGCDTGELLPASVVFTADNQPDGAVISEDGRTIVIEGQGSYTVDPATGVVTFTPVPTFTGTATPVTYAVTDTNGATVSSTVTITVTPVTPVAVDDSANTVFNTPVELDLLGNDAAGDEIVPLVPSRTVFPSEGQPEGVTVSEDGKTLTIPGQGTYVLNDKGVAVFTPETDWSGTTTQVVYRIEDENGTQREAKVQVTVRPGPTAAADSDTTLQGIAVTVSPLENDTPSRNADDSDGEWDAASVVFPTTDQPDGATVSDDGKTLTVPGQGEYTIAENGEVTFQPEPTFTGTATPVTYAVTDENGNSASSTITITVTPVIPTAVDDSATTPFATPVTFDFADDDTAGDPAVPLVIESAYFDEANAPAGVEVEIRDEGKTIEIVGQGTFTLNDDGTVTFTPADGFSGATAPVTYTILDANGTAATATLTVTVQPGPVLENDVDRTPQNTPVTVNVLGNDTAGLDADGERGELDPTSVVFPVDGQTVGTVSDDGKKLTVPGEGVYTIDPETGEVTFTPEPQFRGGATSVVYAVTDSLGNTGTATLTITVLGVDPVARDDSATTTPGTSVVIDVLANDSGATDVPLDPTTLKLVDADGNLVDTIVVPGEGTWTVVEGKLQFTPLPDFRGTTTPVTYSIADINGTRTTAEVVVTVTELATTGLDVPWLPIGGALFLLLGGLSLMFLRRYRTA
ncbi:Ig-like domain-containing protein [Microbacterium sp. ZW T5_45]|uniref:Ig-like domain-containing protein n=1 Tax=Microbacterium sp. ZW T5_45 TaxID=3378080 RepID=UPI003854291E